MERKKFDETLAGKRILLLDGEINKELANNIRYWLTALNLQSQKEEIKLIIDSSGGHVEPGLWLFDTFLLLKAPVTGLVCGRCESTALIVLQGCKKRLATPHSRFFLHFVQKKVDLPVDNDFEEKIKIETEAGKKFQASFEQILSKKMRMTISEIRKLMEKGEKNHWFFSSQEALSFGLIDGIVKKPDYLF